MNLGTAVVTLIVAAIGAGAGFIGGYLSARWRARNDLAQWRRDRLLTYCVDLISGGREISVRVWRPQDPYPQEAVQRLDDAVGGILLLGGQELDDLAFAYQSAVLDALNDQLGVAARPQNAKPPLEVAANAQGAFLWKAHNLLLDALPKSTIWSRWWQPARMRLARKRGGRAAADK
jgi:hypothetical protein